MSLAHTLRPALEERGEYVVMANESWFAVFPSTLQARIERSRVEGREGPNLIVYQTKSDLPRDHYVIPYSVIRHLLVSETITESGIDGTRRWNLTLTSGRLHVSHRAGTMDVSAWHGKGLIVESDGIADFDIDVHSSGEAAREGGLRLVAHLRRERDRKIVLEKKATAHSLECEICGFSFENVYGRAAADFCEAHHLKPLSEVESVTETRLEDLALLCSNCHRVVHLCHPPYSLDEVRAMIGGNT